MLLWLCVYLVAVFCLPKWADMLFVLAAALPALAVCKETPIFGSRDCNLIRYPKRAYALTAGFMISGCALLSFAVSLLSRLLGGGTATASGGRGDFLYLFVFSCLLPAFFEELLLRGRILGLVARERGFGIWLCAALFALMHIQLPKLPYAFFAGLILTLLVYLTECVYLGMLLHFANNFAALLLSRLPDTAAYVAAALLAALFIFCFVRLKKTRLYADAVGLLREVCPDAFFAGLHGAVWLFAALTLSLGALYLIL